MGEILVMKEPGVSVKGEGTVELEGMEVQDLVHLLEGWVRSHGSAPNPICL